MNFIEVAKISELTTGKMKKVEIQDNEILLANVNGTIYAVDDRCGHMNVSLSAGELHGKLIICPLHKAKFDITTGKNIEEPHLPGIIKKTGMGKLMGKVKTHNLHIYEVQIDERK